MNMETIIQTNKFRLPFNLANLSRQKLPRTSSFRQMFTSDKIILATIKSNVFNLANIKSEKNNNRQKKAFNSAKIIS
jgi:hypothetical protein